MAYDINFEAVNNDGFDKMAPVHDNFYNRPEPLINENYQHIVNYIKKLKITGNKLIELGCGTGDLSLFLANAGYNVTGIDRSENMLTVARNKLAIYKKSIDARNSMVKNPNFVKNPGASTVLSNIMPKIKFLKSDIFSIDSINEQCNISVMDDVLSYIEPGKIETAFQKINSITFKNGIFLFNMPTCVYFNNHFKVLDKECEHLNYTIDNFYDDHEKINKTHYAFKADKALNTEITFDLYQFCHDLKQIARTLMESGFEIVQMIPDTPVQSMSDTNIYMICDAIEATYSMRNGVKNLVVIGRKIN